MKNRILAAAIAVIICFASILPAFAAQASGYFTPYDITVTSDPGAVLYDYMWNDSMSQGVMRPITLLVPIGTQLTVTDEVEFNGEIYLAIEYKDFYAYIKSSKTIINIQNVGEEASYPTAAERSVVIINKDGVCLRKGPSFVYGTSSEAIPFGTVVNYNAVNCETESSAKWAYTEYKGVAGWLYIHQFGETSHYDCAYILSEADRYTGSLITLTDGAFLTESPDSATAKTVENIPSNTTLTFKYFYEFHDTISAFVEYNGVKGWLRARNTSYKIATGEKGGIYIVAEDGLPLYEKPFTESDKPVAVVPAGTNLSIDYVNWDAAQSGNEVLEYKWMHTVYNGTEGWLFSADASEYCYMLTAFDLKIAAENGLNLYTSPNTDSEVISTVPGNTTVSCIYEINQIQNNSQTYWSFVEYGGKQGWIYSTETETVYIEGSEKQLDAPFGAQPIEAEKSADAPELVDKSTHLIIIAAGAGVAVIAVIAVAIIIKKKKSK